MAAQDDETIETANLYLAYQRVARAAKSFADTFVHHPGRDDQHDEMVDALAHLDDVRAQSRQEDAALDAEHGVTG